MTETTKVDLLAVDYREDGWILVRRADGERDAGRAAYEGALADGYDPDDIPDLVLVREGSFRWNPCNEKSCWDGGGHRVHLGYAHGERGSFHAWLFR
jgi:hypothetical protein